NGLGSGALAGMGSEPQPFSGSVLVLLSKQLGRGFLFVAADTDADYISFAVFRREFKHILGSARTEMAHRVKYPKQRDAEVFLATLAATFQAFKDGIEILLSPQADTDRHVHFGVQHISGLELLHQAIGDQFIIFGSSQLFGESLEGHQKTEEILVLVERFCLRDGAMFAVLAPEFDQGLRRDRTFQMQVQLSLRQSTDKSGSHQVKL